MNHTTLSTAPIRPRRLSTAPQHHNQHYQCTEPSLTLALPAHTRYDDAPTAPLSISSAARRSSSVTQGIQARRAALGELAINGRSELGRHNSPTKRRAARIRSGETILVHDEDVGNTLVARSASAADNTTTHLDLPALGAQARTYAAARRRPVASILAERLAAQSVREEEEGEQSTASSAPVRVREARRRTVYIPEDATDLVTIHPGSRGSAHGREEDEGTQRGLLHRPVRRGNVLSQRPRRRSSMMNASVLDGVCEPQSTGLGTLVEGVVPDVVEERAETTRVRAPIDLAKKPRRRSMAVGMATSSASDARNESRLSVAPQLGNNSVSRPGQRRALGTVTTNRRASPKAKPPSIMVLEKKKALFNKRPMRRSIRPGSEHPDDDVMFIVGKPAAAKTLPKTSPKTSLHNRQRSSPTVNKRIASNFPVLKDHMAHPELYEDNWLERQEVALTQLLNTFFEMSNLSAREEVPFDTLRSSMVRAYNDPEVPHLVKRLQASLAYGSLAVPKEILAKSMRLKEDVGQKRKFLDTFVQVYDLTALLAAAEAIVGRECLRKRTSTDSNSNGSDSTSRGDRRSIEHFLDTFFIQHSDVSAPKTGTGMIASIARDQSEQVGSPVWAWRRTVVRSLMLVQLLDTAKNDGLFHGCLFQSTSPYKSSEAVVKAIGTLLLPSYGDLMRPLRHLKYDVLVEQNTLEEYNYHVDNIATDLRDGILLTRVVEILLGQDHAASTSQPENSKFWKLSQHLKYPCPGRTHKLQNTMVALSALVRLPGVPERLLKDITAFDIVDGHREKTLSLLWALLGQFAMDKLVDWDMLRRETIATQQSLAIKGVIDNSFEDVAALDSSCQHNYNTMLLQWAKALAAQQDLTVNNLTTSFAGTNVFRAIINTYAQYVPHSSSLATDAPTALRAIGCSASFTALLSGTTHSIPTATLTLTSLLFLASRLLPLARTARAASIVQRSWRVVLQRRRISQRVALLRMATHCAAVVNARDRVVGAATVLQRAWRRVLERRIAKLEGDVVGVQALARAWLVRNRVDGERERKGRGGKMGMMGRAGW